MQTKNNLERQEHQKNTYARETWTLVAEVQRTLQSLELSCFRKILGISYKDRTTNEHVRKTVIKHIGPYDDLLATVKRRKLGIVWAPDNIRRRNQSYTSGNSRRRTRSRPKKRWTDNIAEWTGKSFAETLARAWHTTGRSEKS